MKETIEKNSTPIRKHVRLQGFDHSLPNAYFVTICTHNKQCLFGAVENGTMNLNQFGEIVQKCWNDLQKHYGEMNNNIFTVMPNHIHGIIMIHEDTRRSGSKPDPTKKHPLSEIIRAFKTYSSRNMNELRHTKSTVIWQHSYYEHVIRDEKDFQEIGEYILYNPSKWESDKDNPNSNF